MVLRHRVARWGLLREILSLGLSLGLKLCSALSLVLVLSFGLRLGLGLSFLLLAKHDGVLHHLVADTLSHLLLLALTRVDHAHETTARRRQSARGDHVDQRPARHPCHLLLFARGQIGREIPACGGHHIRKEAARFRARRRELVLLQLRLLLVVDRSHA